MTSRQTRRRHGHIRSGQVKENVIEVLRLHYFEYKKKLRPDKTGRTERDRKRRVSSKSSLKILSSSRLRKTGSEDPLDCLSHGFASACHSMCESVACQTQALGIKCETVYLSVHLVSIALVALFMPLIVSSQLWYPPSQSAMQPLSSSLRTMVL